MCQAATGAKRKKAWTTREKMTNGNCAICLRPATAKHQKLAEFTQMGKGRKTDKWRKERSIKN
jgi:hypothetical protein